MANVQKLELNSTSHYAKVLILSKSSLFPIGKAKNPLNTVAIIWIKKQPTKSPLMPNNKKPREYEALLLSESKLAVNCCYKRVLISKACFSSGIRSSIVLSPNSRSFSTVGTAKVSRRCTNQPS